MSLPLIKATYSAQATDVWFDTTKAGDPKICVVLSVNGESITWTGFFSEKTKPRTIESLRYLGWKGSDLTELDGHAELLSAPVSIVCEPEEYKGEIQLKVRWINSPDGAPPRTRLTGAELKAKIGSISTEGGKDDIPFMRRI